MSVSVTSSRLSTLPSFLRSESPAQPATTNLAASIDMINTLPLSEASSLIEEAFQQRSHVWIHGDPSIQNAAIEAFKKECKVQHVFYIRALESREAFAEQWSRFCERETKNGMPDNNFNSFEETWKGRPYLIIFTNLSLKHFDTLFPILMTSKTSEHRYLLSSQEELGEKSLSFSADESWYQSFDPDFQAIRETFPDSFELCLMARRLSLVYGKPVVNFLEDWKALCRKPSKEALLELFENEKISLKRALQTLSLFGRAPLPEEFLKRLFMDQTNAIIATLIASQMISKQDESFMLSDPFPVNDPSAVSKYAKILREDIPSKFDKSQAWIIPIALEFFRVNFQDVQKKTPDSIVNIASIMLDIGHYYTQEGHPSLALKCTEDAREKIEKYVKIKAGEGQQKKGEKIDVQFKLFTREAANSCVEELNKIHPILPFLYMHSQYQIGRIYFYHRTPEEREASESVLLHGLALAEAIEKQLKIKPFIGFSIRRNGLLFHKRDAGDFLAVIEGYKSLMDDKNSYVDLSYQNGDRLEISPANDLQNRVTCLQYLVEAKIKQGMDVSQDIETLRSDIGKLKDPPVRLFSLAQSYVLTGDTLKSAKILSDMEALVSEKQWDHRLKLLRGWIQHYVHTSNFTAAAEKAIQYRELALKRYGNRSLTAFYLVPLEDSSIANQFKEKGLSYVEEVGRFLMNSILRKPLHVRNYRWESNRLLFDLCGDNISHLFFFKREFVSQDPLILHLGQIVKEPGIKKGDKPIFIQTFEINLKRNSLQVPKKSAPWVKQKAKKFKLIEEEKDDTIVFHIDDSGKNKSSLTISKRLVEYLQKKGEWDGLKKTLEDGSFFSSPDNIYSTSSGYRLKLDPFTKAVTQSLPLSQAPILQDEWSDDEDSIDKIQSQRETFQNSADEIEQKNTSLRQESTFYPVFETQEDDFDNKVEFFKKEVEKSSQIGKSLKALTHGFAQGSRDRQEYAESYLKAKWIAREKSFVSSKEKSRLDKIDAELAQIRARESYLKLKKEKINKRSLQELSNEKVKDLSSSYLFEEIEGSFEGALNVEIVKKAAPIACKNLSEKNEIHFQNPSSFAYHVLKHQEPPPFSSSQGTIAFDLAQFSKNADQYLEETRALARMGKNLICRLPDQHDPKADNIRYMSIVPAQDEIKKRLEIQKEISLQEDNILRLQKIRDNLRYTGQENEEIKSAITLENKSLELLKTQSKDVTGLRECAFTVISNQSDTGATFFKTQFTTRVQMDKLPRGLISIKDNEPSASDKQEDDLS